jgi:hypothetical protein
MTTDLDSTHAAAVDHGYHWQPMATCPKRHEDAATDEATAARSTAPGRAKRRSTKDGRRCRRGRREKGNDECLSGRLNLQRPR